MKRKAMIIVLLGTLVLTGAFARGGMEPGRRLDAAEVEEFKTEILATINGLETKTYSGELYFVNRIHPELHSGDKVYQLMHFPMHLFVETGLEDGSYVTVTAAPVTAELLETYSPMGRGGFGPMYRYSDEEAPVVPEDLLLVIEGNISGETFSLTQLIEEDEYPLMKGRRGGFRGHHYRR